MQIRPEQLDKHLQSALQRIYLVTGDEPLIVQECSDAIRTATRSAGATEREVIEVTAKDDWHHLHQIGGALSLFAERKLIELKLPSGKPGAEGSKALLDYLAVDSEDFLLIVAGKIDKQSQRSKWYTALDAAGAIITVWPVATRELPRWLGQRLAAAGLSADHDALQLLADRVEGNLLAAVQEIEKLKLLAAGSDRITTETVLGAVLDSARYNAFGLADTALAGDARSAIRTLRGLRAEATAPPAVLWVLAREVRLLLALDADRARGQPLARAMQARGVWRNRTGLVESALGRHTSAGLMRLQRRLYSVDASVKGFGSGNPWDHLERLVVELANGTGSSSMRRRA